MKNQPIRTYLAIEPAGDRWRAYEPRSAGDTEGHGPTPPAAVIDYAEQVEAKHE